MDHNMIMNSESLAPFVINLPYGQYSREAFEKAFDESLEKQMGRSVNDSDLEHFMLRYVICVGISNGLCRVFRKDQSLFDEERIYGVRR